MREGSALSTTSILMPTSIRAVDDNSPPPLPRFFFETSSPLTSSSPAAPSSTSSPPSTTICSEAAAEPADPFPPEEVTRGERAPSPAASPDPDEEEPPRRPPSRKPPSLFLGDNAFFAYFANASRSATLACSPTSQSREIESQRKHMSKPSCSPLVDDLSIWSARYCSARCCFSGCSPPISSQIPELFDKLDRAVDSCSCSVVKPPAESSSPSIAMQK